MSKLLFLDGVRIQVPAAGDVSAKWCQIFPLGTFHRSDFPKGGITFDAKTLGAMVKNWEAMGRPAKQVNYFHRGASENDGVPNEDKVAAGWIEGLELRDDGLYGLIKWTDRARAHILADELRYLSPEFSLNGTNKLTGRPQGPTLYGAALLNDPFLEVMPKVAASDTTTQADEAEGVTKMELLKLAALLAIAAESATEETIEARIRELNDKAAAGDTEVKSLSDAKVSLSEQVTKLTEQVATVTAEKDAAVKKLADFEQAQKIATVDAFVKARTERAIVTGAKVEALRELALSNLPLAEKLYPLDAKPVVDLSEKGVSSGDAESEKKAAQARLDERVKALRSANPEMKYREATEVALREMPELNTTLFGEGSKTTRA